MYQYIQAHIQRLQARYSKMSFGGKTTGEVLPRLKAFVSEDEIDEKRKKRQEEWEKVRKPEEPMGNDQ